MDDLREPIHRIVKSIVKAVHENEHLVSSGLPGRQSDRGSKRPFIQIVRGYRDEIARGVSWNCRWPLNLTNFPNAVRRNGNGNRRIRNICSSLATKHLPRISR